MLKKWLGPHGAAARQNFLTPRLGLTELGDMHAASEIMLNSSLGLGAFEALRPWGSGGGALRLFGSLRTSLR